MYIFYAKLLIYSGLIKRLSGLEVIKTFRDFKRFFLISFKLPNHLINFYILIEILRLLGIDILLIKSLINKIFTVLKKK